MARIGHQNGKVAMLAIYFAGTAMGTVMAIGGMFLDWATQDNGAKRFNVFEEYQTSGTLLGWGALVAGLLGVLALWLILMSQSEELQGGRLGSSGDEHQEDRVPGTSSVVSLHLAPVGDRGTFATVFSAASAAIAGTLLGAVVLLLVEFPTRSVTLPGLTQKRYPGPFLSLIGLLLLLLFSSAAAIKWKYIADAGTSEASDESGRTPQQVPGQRLHLSVLSVVMAGAVILDFFTPIWIKFPMLGGVVSNSLVLALTVVGYEAWRERTRANRFEGIMKVPEEQFEQDKLAVRSWVLPIRTAGLNNKEEGVALQREIARFLVKKSPNTGRNNAEKSRYLEEKQEALAGVTKEIEVSLSRWAGLIYDSHTKNLMLTSGQQDLLKRCRDLQKSWKTLVSDVPIPRREETGLDLRARLDDRLDNHWDELTDTSSEETPSDRDDVWLRTCIKTSEELLSLWRVLTVEDSAVA